ncbi:MAG: drug resistance protein [Candidatus Wolfebacteria bacterium GW2011_GWE2_44_13]|uniref:Drug resistance protein n=1 Tax=Candidatus Wolfebacteria bacterium GW2011_GWE2_44_13 TaxID=1619017 RepID=A0A0G1HA98_9BACT|nr:MAG: drug resistance protein [Candidatus Wolfebacteria bacterium GW2011_GWE2_44_13]
MQLYLAILAKFPVGVLLTLAAGSVIVGDYFGKLWSTQQRPLFLVIAFLGYFGSGFFYLPTLLREGLLVTSIIWSLLSIVGFMVIGLLIFKETLTGIQAVGVGFGVISLVILAFASH